MTSLSEAEVTDEHIASAEETSEYSEAKDAAVNETQQKTTRSGRLCKPTVKIKETIEIQFWDAIQDTKHVIRKIERDLTHDCPVALKIQMEKEALHAIEDVELAYEQLRSAFQQDTPANATKSTDRSIENLKRLLNRLKPPEDLEIGSRRSSNAASSSKRSQLAAETAALEIELEAKRIEAQQMLELASLEAKEKARQAETQIEIQKKRAEIENKRIETELRKNRAEMAALEQESSKHSFSRQPIYNTSTVDIAKILSENLALSRLPNPEPRVFDGNCMHYTAWKSEFNCLITNKGVPKEDKMYYLRKYLTGEALEAVEGLTYLCTEEAYNSTWKILEERFGNPLVVAGGFRDKIRDWPRIDSKDGKGLRRFADYLRQCLEAMSTIPSLSILNDSKENQEMLRKLPDWVLRRWGRIVTEEESVKFKYPSFATFVDYLQKEAKVACNPMMLSLRETTKIKKRTPAANTNKQDIQNLSQESSPHQKTFNPRNKTNQTPANPPRNDSPATQQRSKPSCLLCERSNHDLRSCYKFTGGTPEQRRDFIMSNGLCFSCLGARHRSRDCTSKLKCSKCGNNHPTALCGDYEALYKHKTQKDSTKEITGVSLKSYTDKELQVNQSTTSSMIVPVFLSSKESPNTEVLVYALLDTQSDTSFISSSTLERLGVNKIPTKLKLTTMTNTSTIDSAKVQNLLIRGMNTSSKLTLRKAYSRESIPCNIEHIPCKEVSKRWPHLRQLTSKIPERQNCEVGLLIGYDCPQALAPLQVIRGEASQPFGIETELGWSIVGSMSVEEEDNLISHKIVAMTVSNRQQCNTFQSSNVCYVNRIRVKEEVPSKEIIKILESDFPEKRNEETKLSQEDMRFLDILRSESKHDYEGYMQMPLPFKTENPVLPDNKNVALKRLWCLKKRLQRDEEYFKDYKDFMAGMIQRGEAERVPEEEVDKPSWYLPHHGVYHPKKPGKIRVVYDCSAQYMGMSLNDHLLQGPDLMNSLPGVLCRLREHPIAITGDIEKMFHQFTVTPQHRNYLRFLWWADGHLTKDPDTFRMKVHLFGATSSPGCANFGLKKLATDNQDENPAAAEFMKHNFYVDDGLGSVHTEEEAVDLLKGVQHICSKGNLRFHKIMSNSPIVMDSVPEADRAADIKNRTFEDSPVGRVLGVEWALISDEFQFRLTIPEKPLTRRGVLSAVASVFDPLGFLAPFQLLGKQLLQRLCQENCGWDDDLPDDLKMCWSRWLIELPKLVNLKIPRCFVPENFGAIKRCELHHFSDASFNGYGQCTYLRIKNEDNNVHCSFVMGKSRVVPKKILTIPRLELAAAVTSVKVSNFLRTELTYKAVEYFWSDSKIVLGYIKNDGKRFHVFVANRVQCIRENSQPQQWHYVSSEENPADHASRGMYAEELINSNWLSGPDFLWKSEITEEEYIDTEILVADPEVRAVSNAANVHAAEDILERLEHFSDWHRAVSGLSVILSFIARKKNREYLDIRHVAEMQLFKMIQACEFKEEIATIKQGKCLPQGNRILKLDPFIDQEDILRVGGRLSESSYPEETKHPIILPKSGHLIKLLIRTCHEKVLHQGRSITTNEIRARGFWILGCSQVVSSYLHKCVTCRKLRGKNLNQKMANLPIDRLEATAPFTHCGMDCFGPFLVKEARKEIKRYGLIFTCMASRAIHIELLDDMTTDAFINGLRCFIALRGTVQTLRSDQGSNFVGAERELRTTIQKVQNEQFRKFLEKHQCRFIMNPPHSSHMGGSWERHIRTVRSVLSAMLSQHGGRLDTSTLRTFLYEAMAIVNSRPLTACDLNDPFSEPLTPNHLLMVKTHVVLTPPGNFTREDVYARKRWRKVQYLANDFWSKWRKSYLMTLQTRQKWHKNVRNVEVGDIVLLTDEEPNRGTWRLGKVLATIPSADGHVRKVKLLVAASGPAPCKASVLERPIHKLVLLLENDNKGC